MKRAIAFVAGAILCVWPATDDVINGASVLGLTLIATSVVTHIVIERQNS